MIDGPEVAAVESPPAGTAAAYFNAVAALAERATHRAGARSVRYRIGGRTAHFRFAGDALIDRLTPALRHLVCEPDGAADLTVDLWDSASTGIPMVAPPWGADELRVCGEIPSLIERGIYAHYNVYHNALTIFDRDARRAVYWIRDARHVPDHETASPLFALFHSWASRDSLHHIHAAAVGLPDGGALLVGANGAGKSNTALACLDSPLRIAGDDRCLVGLTPAPAVHSIYCTAKSHPRDVERFPSLAARRGELAFLASGKTLYFVEDLYPGKMIDQFPLRAVLLLSISGRRDTAFERGSAAAALMTIAPYSSLRWPSSGRQTLHTLSQVLRSVPCYRLLLGTDVPQIPRAIMEILRPA